MQSHLEERLQKDINRIRDKVIEMGNLVERGLELSLKAIKEKKHQLAYSVILRDRYIDNLERELDKLCQEFLIRQQPVSSNLRFVYAVIKINNELERMGDYSESISRHFLKVMSFEPEFSFNRIEEIASLSIAMVRNAISAFVNQDEKLARETMKKDEKVNRIRYELNHSFVNLNTSGKLNAEALTPLMLINNRFERVADQACNVCEEVLYMCTGEDVKHKETQITQMLFVDERDACRAQMAEGIANSLNLKNFHFSSAGIAPKPIDTSTIQFMNKKGIDISKQKSKYLNQIINLEYYDVIIALCEEAEEAFPPPPTKTVSIRWNVDNPSKVKGSEEKIQQAYENTYKYLYHHIGDIIKAIIGKEYKSEEE